MDPPHAPFVFPPWSFAGPSRSGRAPTFSAMLTDLLVGYGLMERRPSLREQMAEQLRIERLAEELQDLDSPAALGSPEISPARPRKRRKGNGGSGRVGAPVRDAKRPA